MRGYESDDRIALEREWDETAEAVGRELDKLWRTHAIDWLRKCDDPHYLADWFDTQIYSQGNPITTKAAVTAATAWHLAGNSSRAAEILNILAAECELIISARADTKPETAEKFRNIIGSAHKLATELGLAL